MRICALSAAAFCLALTGCATPRPPLYAWDDYQPQVYQYLKDDGNTDPHQQLITLEKTRQRIQAQGKALPPGYRAHMALLYSKAGDSERTVQQLTEEKQSFPESATFMDQLLQTFASRKKD